MKSPQQSGPGGESYPYKRARLRTLPNARDETNAASIVRRCLTEISGEAPADICHVAIVTRGCAASATYGRVSPGRSSVIRIREACNEAAGAGSAGHRSDF